LECARSLIAIIFGKTKKSSHKEILTGQAEKVVRIAECKRETNEKPHKSTNACVQRVSISDRVVKFNFADLKTRANNRDCRQALKKTDNKQLLLEQDILRILTARRSYHTQCWSVSNLLSSHRHKKNFRF
jgi:hypothetical protein